MQIVTLRRSRSPLCGRIKQLHLNGVIRSAGVAQWQEHSGMQRSRFKPRAGNKNFFHFLLFAINKAYF